VDCETQSTEDQRKQQNEKNCAHFASHLLRNVVTLWYSPITRFMHADDKLSTDVAGEPGQIGLTYACEVIEMWREVDTVTA